MSDFETFLYILNGVGNGGIRAMYTYIGLEFLTNMIGVTAFVWAICRIVRMVREDMD